MKDRPERAADPAASLTPQIFETLGLHTNSQLTHFAIEHGLVEL